MSMIPQKQHTVQSLIDAYHESQQEGARYHYGLSMAGDKCERKLWYLFRWAIQQKFPGRILRLFRRGQMEEDTIVQDLKAIGIEVVSQQMKVSYSYGVSGSIDGVAVSGVPEAPNTPHLVEFKTHSKKSFDVLVAKGVQEAQPKHYSQMQTYMHGIGLDRALYFAVCKDDDRIHTERIKYDKQFAEKMIERSIRIARSEEPPIRISENPSWYECKMCPALKICHHSEPTVETNCRTCIHSTLLPSGRFKCERWESEIPMDVEKVGCRSHVVRPHLVPWELIESKCTDVTACYLVDGREVMQGEEGFTLQEVLTAGGPLDDVVKTVQEVFDGEIVG